MSKPVITIGMLAGRLATIIRENDGDRRMPLRLSLQGGSGQIKRMDIDLTTGHLELESDGTVVIDVRGRLGD